MSADKIVSGLWDCFLFSECFGALSFLYYTLKNYVHFTVDVGTGKKTIFGELVCFIFTVELTIGN